MDDRSLENLQWQVKELERHNHLLKKQLEHSEAHRADLEKSYENQSKFVNQIIQGLERSRLEAETRSQELQESLNNLKMMQAKLVESEKMSALGVLVAGIAHEINNPINFIHGNVSHAYAYVESLVDLLHLYQQAYPNPTQRITALSQEIDLEFVVKDLFKLLNSMQIGSDRIRKIVLGLRTFSRLDEAEYKEADLHEGLDSTLMLLQHRLKPRATRSGITVVKDYESTLPKIPCFPGQLNQVFMNILTNGIDAIEERQAMQSRQNYQPSVGRITIGTAMSGKDWVEISIADDGSGMSEEVQQRIFNPFFTTKPPGRGTGMGLSISYQIVVENHGGKIECFSTPGEGTRFVMLIPVRQQSSIAL